MKTKEEVRKLIEKIEAERQKVPVVGPDFKLGDTCPEGKFVFWWHGLSEETKKEIEEMGWPWHVVGGGKDSIEHWAERCHQI